MSRFFRQSNPHFILFGLLRACKRQKSKNTIVIDMEDGTFQYVYYDDSVILKRLLIYPYAQLTVVFVFIVIAFLALAKVRKN